MATGKRYYWIKLRESFMTSDTVDFLMGQKEGANYVVLYQMLCLKTINTGGRLSRTIGEYMIPYDVEKIQRDCKWFSIDTIRIALNLYKGLGLIYEERDGTLVLADYNSMVGSETNWAEQKRNQRNETLSMPEGGQCPPECPQDVREIVHPDIRDKDIRDEDIRDESLDTDSKDIPSCSERSDDHSKQGRDDPIVFRLESNVNGSFYEVHKSEIERYRGLYPAVNIEQEYRKMVGWIEANRSRRKTLRGMPRFINRWLADKQDKGGGKGGGQRDEHRGGPGRGNEEHPGSGWGGEGLL